MITATVAAAEDSLSVAAGPTADEIASSGSGGTSVTPSSSSPENPTVTPSESEAAVTLTPTIVPTSTVYRVTPIEAPYSGPQLSSFDGNRFPNGTVVGTDIGPGRWWTVSCNDYKVFDSRSLVTKGTAAVEQVIIDVVAGDTVLSVCTWYAGEPPVGSRLPSGRVSFWSQLTPGTYRPMQTQGCVTGPSDTRSTDAVVAARFATFWWEDTPDLVVDGTEPWSTLWVDHACGGLRRIS